MSRRTGVALLITELNVGGAERALTQLALGLDPQEFEVTVYSLASRPVPGADQLVKRLERAGIPIEFLAARGVWQTAAIIGRLRSLLRRDRPQVLLSFLYHANVIGGLALATLSQAPVHVAAVRVAEPSTWRLRLEGVFLRRAAKVTCVSSMLADYVAEHQRVSRRQIETIANGVDWEIFASAQPADLNGVGIGPQRRLLVSIGRLEPQKGFDWLLSEVDTLLEPLPNHDLVIVGEGPRRADLEQQANTSRYRERIHFLGRRDNIPAILKRSELFLLPSRYEGMPNVVLEAMAAGLPIVARQVEGVDQLLGRNDSRQIVPFSDVNAFYKCIYDLASDASMRAELGLANQQRVAQHFSWQNMIDQYRDLLRVASTRGEKKSS